MSEQKRDRGETQRRKRAMRGSEGNEQHQGKGKSSEEENSERIIE
jgi:hypothetical protein